MTISIEILKPDFETEQQAFLDDLGKESASVLGYHYPFYQKMLAQIGIGTPLVLGAFSKGKLVGILPAFEKTNVSGTVINSLPFFGPNGGVLSALNQKEKIHDLLIHSLLDKARERNAVSCSIYTPFRSTYFDPYDKAFYGGIVVEKFSQHQNLSAFATKRESSVGRNLRKANRLGVSVSTEVSTERLNTFYNIYKQNCMEYDIPIKPRACINFLAQPEFLGKHTRLYFAIQDEQILGGLMVLWSPKVVSYYIPCSLVEARGSQPSTILIDYAMSEARERGMKVWNWESSPGRNSGVYNFKKKWGAAESNYRVYITSYAGREIIQALGREGITREFPYFFVWPFDNL